MTPKTLAVLKFIRNYVKKHEIPPTYKEIKEKTEVSQGGLNYILRNLETDGKIIRKIGRDRGSWPT